RHQAGLPCFFPKMAHKIGLSRLFASPPARTGEAVESPHSAAGALALHGRTRQRASYGRHCSASAHIRRMVWAHLLAAAEGRLPAGKVLPLNRARSGEM